MSVVGEGNPYGGEGAWIRGMMQPGEHHVVFLITTSSQF